MLNASNKRLSSERARARRRRRSSVGRTQDGGGIFLTAIVKLARCLITPSPLSVRFDAAKGGNIISRPTMAFRVQIYGRGGGRDARGQRQNIYWDGPLNWDKGCFSNIALLLRML